MRKFKADVRNATERNFSISLKPECAPGCDVSACDKDHASFPAAKGGGTCYNPAQVGKIDQVCCAINSCPCTSITGKGIATRDASGQCPEGCNGTCNFEAIDDAVKGIINDDIAKCLEPIDVMGRKCCSASSGCVCTAVRTLKQGTDVAIAPPIDSAAAALYDAIMLWARAASRVLAAEGAAPALHGPMIIVSFCQRSGLYSAGDMKDGKRLFETASVLAFPGVERSLRRLLVAADATSDWFVAAAGSGQSGSNAGPDVEALCENPMTAEALSALQAGWNAMDATDRTSVLQRLYTSAGMSSATEKGLSLTTPGQVAYDAAHKKYHHYFTKLLATKGFTDGYLFDLDGNCIYSVTKKSDFATSIVTGPYASSGLGQAFQAAKSNAQGTDAGASMIDFSPYAPTQGTIASFVAAGVFNPQGQLLGVAAVLQPSYILQATTMPDVKSAMIAFRSAWGELAGSGGSGGARSQVQKAYISDNLYPVGSRDMLISAPGPQQYHATHQQYHDTFRKLVEARGYYDLYLIDMDGNCIYSVAKQSDFGTNVVDGPYASSGIGQAFQAAKLNPQARSVIDFSSYAPSQGALARFLSMGVFGDGDVLTGVLIAQVPVAHQVVMNADGDRVESCVLLPFPLVPPAAALTLLQRAS